MGRQGHTGAEHRQGVREADVAMAKGQTVGQVCWSLGIIEPPDERWWQDYGELQGDQANRLKDLEREKTRLKRVVAGLTFDTLILTEAVEGSAYAQIGAIGTWHRSAGSGRVGCWASPARSNGITDRPLLRRQDSLPISSEWPSEYGDLRQARPNQ